MNPKDRVEAIPVRELERVHRALSKTHAVRLNPVVELDSNEQAFASRLQADVRARCWERRLVEQERAEIAHELRRVPQDEAGFVAWFEDLKASGPGQNDALFPWLAQRATLEEMRWFLEQEVAGEAGFDDLVALAQLKLPSRPKLELARNYWDEMGQGHEQGMHGPMLLALERELALDTTRPVWEALALGNMMVAMAMSREYAYLAIGALGVIELTAPGRAEQVNLGLKRLGVSGSARRYFALHATLDVRHSETWIREVFRPLIAAQPRVALRLAEGALIRLRAGARCFERYRSELWGDVPRSQRTALRSA